jgi:biopolymer transport protein ExbB
MNERIFAIAHYVDQGVLYLLLLLCFLSLFMIVDRWFALKKRVRNSKEVQRRLGEALNAQNFTVLDELAKEEGPEAQVVRLGQEHFRRNGNSGVEEVCRTVGMMEKPGLERYLGFLATVGSNGPYIGLFGTVLGIMKSFNDMGATGGGGSSVMAGISSALIATAAGLMVAIPAVLAYNFFQRQVKSVYGGLEACKEMVFLWEKTLRKEA